MIQEAALDDVIAEYLAAVERGQAPDPEDWVARHPGYAAELVAFLNDLGQFAEFLGLPAVSNTDLTRDYVPADGLSDVSIRGAGERFGEYELLGEPIGKGGMGVVYRARLVGTSLEVALKQVRVSGSEAAGLFFKEIEAAAGLRHPNIVPIYHVGKQDERPFFTMALVEGGSLDRQLSRFSNNPRAAATLVVQVARAVHYAHQRRVLHRDLKPSNILIDEQGEPHVADFGLATRLTDAGATVDVLPPAGSLPWMAPEAVRGDATLTTGVDVWAIGVILYELLTGERPFPGPDPRLMREHILHRQAISPRLLNPLVPRDLDAICRRCLEKEQDRRYESAAAVANELVRWLRDEPVRARRASRAERFARWGRRNPGVASAVLFVAVLLVAVSMLAVTLARAQDDLTRRVVCEDNEHAAELAAGAFLHRLDQHRAYIRDAAEQPILRDGCSPQHVDMARVTRWCREVVETARNPGAGGVVSLYVLDDVGRLRAISSEIHPIVGEDFSFRDYYRGAIARANNEGLDRVHLSRVFPAKNDGLDKIAVSIAFHPTHSDKYWVLAATIPTDPTLGLGVRDDHRHKVILLAPREPASSQAPENALEYAILVHPAYSKGEKTISFPAERIRRIDSEGGRPLFAADEDYADPVREAHPECGGRWLAGLAPVEGTDLIVLVQQRYDDAMAPHRLFFRRFVEWLGGAVVLSGLCFAVVRLVRSRGSYTLNLTDSGK